MFLFLVQKSIRLCSLYGYFFFLTHHDCLFAVVLLFFLFSFFITFHFFLLLSHFSCCVSATKLTSESSANTKANEQTNAKEKKSAHWMNLLENSVNIPFSSCRSAPKNGERYSLFCWCVVQNHNCGESGKAKKMEWWFPLHKQRQASRFRSIHHPFNNTNKTWRFNLIFRTHFKRYVLQSTYSRLITLHCMLAAEYNIVWFT